MDALAARSKAIIGRGSKSFAAAARLFDAQTRRRAYLLYAWCRHCDDCIDGQNLGFGQRSPKPEEQRAHLAELLRKTEAAMAGKPTDDPIFAAFQQAFRAGPIPERYPRELLHGFAMDVERRTFLKLDDTLGYCYGVAGAVGCMMASLMGVRDEATLHRAADLGIALQLTNIARDLMQDAADGRCYLPGEWLEQAGAQRNPAAFPDQPEALFPLVERLLNLADRYYASAEWGIGQLPLRSAWAVSAAGRVYREIGALVRRQGADAWRWRIKVGAPRKVWLAAVAALDALRARRRARRQEPPPRIGLWTAP